MFGYKGFDKNFCCKGMQYEVGKTFTYEDKLVLYRRGYHFCDTPLSILEYYPPNISRYAIVEALEEPLHEESGKHIYCTSKIRILKELTFKELLEIDSSIRIIEEDSNEVAKATEEYRCAVSQSDLSVAATTKDCSVAITKDSASVAVATGYAGVAIAKKGWSISSCTHTYNNVATEGEWSVAASTGYKSTIEALGKNSVAVGVGDESLVSINDVGSLAVSWEGSGAKGVIGSWILLSEYDLELEVIKDARLLKVDGINIMPDTYYKLQNGKVVELGCSVSTDWTK